MTLQAGNLTVQVATKPGCVAYTISSQDWRIEIDNNRFKIVAIAWDGN
jgi:hypothetical protein